MAEAQPEARVSSDLARMMERLKLTPLPSVMAEKKKPVGSLGASPQRIITNIHGLKVPESLQVYRYDVTIQAVKEVNGNEKIIDLTKKARSDAVVTNRKALCREIFLTAIHKHPDVFGKPNELTYDLQSTLFSPKLITEDPDGITYDVTNHFVQMQLPNSRAEIKVKPVKDARVLDASELTRLSSNLDEVDHSLQQYLELETSQTALMNGEEHITYPGGKSFLMNPGNYGFSARDTPDLGHGKFLAIGCQKSIRAESAETKMIKLEGGEVSVAQYFLDRYNIRLQYPKVNLVIESGPQKSEFPIELLHICDNQRVRTEHQTTELVQSMIRACAVPPSTLIPQNDRNGLALGLYGPNKSAHLNAMNIEVVARPVTVNTRVLPPPYIVYGNKNQAQPEPARATWNQRAHYLVPCDLGKWAVYVLGTMPQRSRSTFGPNELQQFLSCFQQQCIKVGIQYVDPSYTSAIAIDVAAVEKEFKAYKEEGYTFMFFVHADNDQSLHKVVKLLERQYAIVTQLVKMQNAGDIVSKGKQQTMENIIHKTK
uniref:PAZ domain-containing protein n=1 Tax=Panagrolaimus sp. PS1159 TaxID=55785 RepID=A0AC35FXC5_9BILA